MLLVLVNAAPQFAPLRHPILRLARSSESYALAMAGFGTLLIVFRMRETIW